MANDRLYLVCVVCEKELCLFKYYPTIVNGYSPIFEDEVRGTLTDFIREHLTTCHPLGGTMHLGQESGFVVVTEAGGPVAEAKRGILDALTRLHHPPTAPETS